MYSLKYKKYYRKYKKLQHRNWVAGADTPSIQVITAGLREQLNGNINTFKKRPRFSTLYPITNFFRDKEAPHSSTVAINSYEAYRKVYSHRISIIGHLVDVLQSTINETLSDENIRWNQIYDIIRDIRSQQERLEKPRRDSVGASLSHEAFEWFGKDLILDGISQEVRRELQPDFDELSVPRGDGPRQESFQRIFMEKCNAYIRTQDTVDDTNRLTEADCTSFLETIQKWESL